MDIIWEAKARSVEHPAQRRVFGAVLVSREPFSAFVKGPWFGGELAGVVTAEEAAESVAELEEAEWRREKGSLMLDSR